MTKPIDRLDIQTPGRQHRCRQPEILAESGDCHGTGLRKSPQRICVGALRELGRDIHERVEIRRLRRHARLAVIPGIGREGRHQPRCIAEIRRIVEHARLQRDAVQVDAVFVQHPGEHAGTGRAVGFAIQELGRIPAIAGGEIALDELLDRESILIDAPEIPVLVRRDRRGIAGADRVDVDEIAAVDEAVRVVLHRVGRWRREARQARVDATRREGAEQQEDRGRSWAAIVEECDGTRRGAHAVGGEVDIEELGRWLGTGRIDRDEMPGRGCVWQRHAAECRDVMCHGRGFCRVGDQVIRAATVGGGIEQWLVGCLCLAKPDVVCGLIGHAGCSRNLYRLSNFYRTAGL